MTETPPPHPPRQQQSLGNGVPARLGGRGAGGSSGLSGLSELTGYLWGSARPPRLLYRTHGVAREQAIASRPADAECAGSSAGAATSPALEGAAPPPPGTIYLYLRFIVFVPNGLLLAGGGPGARHTLAPLSRTAFERLPEADRARLHRPLRAPGSLIVALSEVGSARAASWRNAPCIELHCGERLVRMGAHPALGRPSGQLLSAASTRWEPRLLTMIRELSGAPGPAGRVPGAIG